LDFYQRSVAVSLSALITVDMIGWDRADYLCWPFLHAASACAIPEAVMPHTGLNNDQAQKGMCQAFSSPVALTGRSVFWSPAIFAAIRRASSLVSSLAAERRPSSSSK
jgi:hypothetical protein